MTKHLILDGTNFCYRAGFAISLYNQRQENVSVVFGVLNMIRSSLEEYNPSDCCVCWDYKGSNAKEELFPEYKKNRKTRDEQSAIVYADIGRQIINIQNVLPLFGIKQLKIEGVEGDDLIALLVEQLEKPITVISSDRDMLQLIAGGGVTVFYPPKDQLVTSDNFSKFFGMPADLYLYYRTIVGDPGDGIPGLKGFGDVTASKLLKKFGSWTDLYNDDGILNEEVLKSMNKVQKTTFEEEGKETLVRNYQLMKMGYLVEDQREKVLSEFNTQEVKFDDEGIKKYFLENQFSSYLARYNGWIHPFHRLFYSRQK